MVIMKKLILLIMALISFVLLLGVYETIANNGSKFSNVDNSTKKKSPLENLIASPVDQVSPTGELAELFNLGSDRTDLQRSEALKKLKGKVIKWNLTVYEISAVSGDKYRVQTDSGFDVKRVDEKLRLFSNEVSTEIIVTAKSESDKNKMLSFKTGNKICIKGQLTGDTTFRLLEINPAILCTSE